MYDECIDCKKCLKGCLMLNDFATSPKELLQNMKFSKPSTEMTFSCASCHYCEEVCPQDISFQKLFFEAKQEYAQDTSLLHKYGYKSVLFHQKNSFSKLFTAKTRFQKGQYSSMAFMPGCSLSSYDPALVQKIYVYLQEILPGINIIQQCCAQPTRIVGDMQRFEHYYGKLTQDLEQMQAQSVITACENCYVSLKTHSPYINTISLYEIFAEYGIPKEKRGAFASHQKVALHDPCPTRNYPKLHESIREILHHMRLEFEEFKNNKNKTQCCGSGGMLELTNPPLAQKQMALRTAQTQCEVIMSYCQSCAESMSKGGKIGVHLLDYLFRDFQDRHYEQKQSGTIKKWYNRYRSKTMIQTYKERV